jgi:hypothetical protein
MADVENARIICPAGEREITQQRARDRRPYRCIRRSGFLRPKRPYGGMGDECPSDKLFDGGPLPASALPC